MSINSSDLQATPLPPDRHSAASPARRRLLRGGVVAAPVLMSVASRPAMAAVCTTASAHTSLAGSRQVTTQDCTGRGPAYWLAQNGANGWPDGYFMQTSGNSGKVATTFGSVFGAGTYGNLTFMQVLQAGQSTLDVAGLAAHLVAAVLNAEAGFTPPTVLDVAKAKAIWLDFNSKTFFEPTAGVHWSAAQTIAWLKTTMPL